MYSLQKATSKTNTIILRDLRPVVDYEIPCITEEKDTRDIMIQACGEIELAMLLG